MASYFFVVQPFWEFGAKYHKKNIKFTQFLSGSFITSIFHRADFRPEAFLYLYLYVEAFFLDIYFNMIYIIFVSVSLSSRKADKSWTNLKEKEIAYGLE